MNSGDLVKLRMPFYPRLGSLRTYQYGIVVGVVGDGGVLTEVLLHLYEPCNQTVYTDAAGARALYSFYPEEIESVEVL